MYLVSTMKFSLAFIRYYTMLVMCALGLHVIYLGISEEFSKTICLSLRLFWQTSQPRSETY